MHNKPTAKITVSKFDPEETNSIVNALNNIRFMFNGRKG